MKTAIIVVGSHRVGKSKTINRYLKPKLKISERRKKFQLKNKEGEAHSQSKEEAWLRGVVRSQSLEEAGYTGSRLKAFVRSVEHLDLLVLAARPSNEKPSLLKPLKESLEAVGFTVRLVEIVKTPGKSYYKAKAKEIYDLLTRG
jgi:hypothetical protein